MITRNSKRKAIAIESKTKISQKKRKTANVAKTGLNATEEETKDLSSVAKWTKISNSKQEKSSTKSPKTSSATITSSSTGPNRTATNEKKVSHTKSRRQFEEENEVKSVDSTQINSKPDLKTCGARKRSADLSSPNSSKRLKPDYSLRKRKQNGMVCDKSSFDRFGYDLTELIVSYLPIKDKFRFECLSKQIQSVIFNKQQYFSVRLYNYSYRLLIHNKSYTECKLNYNLFQIVLRKLHFLNALEVDDVVVNKQLFRTVADNCQHLKHFFIYGIASKFKVNKTNTKALEYFGQKCGHKLMSLKICKRFPEEYIKQLLAFTPNLTSIQVRNLGTILSEVKPISKDLPIVLPKLRQIYLKDYTDSQLSQFQEEYCHSVRVIHTYSDRLLSGFSRFRNLQSFTLNYSLDTKPEINKFCNGLSLMAQHCPQLRSLTIDSNDLTKDGIFEVFGKFKYLSTLELRIIEIETESQINYGSVRMWKGLTHLKHLTLDLNQLSDSNVENIDIYLPNLVSISFETDFNITDRTLVSMSKLKSLQTLKIICNNDRVAQNISDSGVKQLLTNCRYLRTLLLYYNFCFTDEDIEEKAFDISRVSVDAFIRRAKQNMNVYYEFKFDWGDNWDQFDRLRASKNFPKNLSI